MDVPQWLGLPLGILLMAFMVFGLLQGGKVKKKQNGDPPDRSGPGFGY